MADSLAEALAAFQAEMPRIAKQSAAIVQTKAGGTYGYKYADLGALTAAVAPLLGKHGLSFTSRPTLSANGFILAYRLMHASGERDEGEYPLPDPIRTSPQMVGSAITYARRYALCAATGIAPDEDDDDGQAAQQEAPAGYGKADPETDKDGAATFAEQTRMMHGPVPGTQRLRAVPDDDKFYDTVPPEVEERTYDSPGTITRAQNQALHTGFKAIGVEDRDQRLKMISHAIGREVTSQSDLSRNEATDVAKRIQEKREAKTAGSTGTEGTTQ